jgi:hypothetical protein
MIMSLKMMGICVFWGLSSQFESERHSISNGSFFQHTTNYYCLLLLFLLTAHLPVQDVSAAAQTHFGAAPFTLQASVIAHLWPVIGALD